MPGTATRTLGVERINPTATRSEIQRERKKEGKRENNERESRVLGLAFFFFLFRSWAGAGGDERLCRYVQSTPSYSKRICTPRCTAFVLLLDFSLSCAACYTHTKVRPTCREKQNPTTVGGCPMFNSYASVEDLCFSAYSAGICDM